MALVRNRRGSTRYEHYTNVSLCFAWHSVKNRKYYFEDSGKHLWNVYYLKKVNRIFSFLFSFCLLYNSTQTSSLYRALLTQYPLTVILKAYRDPPLAWKRNCLIQTTPWSPCSKSCGLGISVRINNDNSKCEMRKDRRLCLLRPCEKSVIKSVKVTSQFNSLKILT